MCLQFTRIVKHLTNIYSRLSHNSHHPLLTSTRPLDSIHRFLFFVSVLTVGGKHCIKQCGDLLKHRFTELMHSSFV